MKLSVLDQSIATQGRSQGDAIRDTLDLAVFCETLGYHRFWVSEHHNHPTIVGTAPEILMAAIAARSTTIRIGSAGVMLPHYAPLKVAEQFRVLDALAPGRIDLGLGRAPGSDGRTAYALNPRAGERAGEFPQDVRDLNLWVHGEQLAEGHPFRSIRALPEGDTAPTIWMLGSSDYGAQVAAHFGLPYAFASFITDGAGAADALHIYRSMYRASPRHPTPQATVCVWALAAETDEEARFHFASRLKWKVYRDKGVWTALDAPEAALAHAYEAADRGRVATLERISIYGSARNVADRLRAMAADLGLDEIVVLTWAHDPEARRTSYRLLSREFGLGC
ncbi:MAG: LLM class flavin-dependent oxidoreductase [Hyphomicrobiaceae bacterium]